jgi:glycosyltransferase involved in cell wall biosynthesis
LPLSISVAMCTYNGARFLPAQLESVATQERPPEELVVCDDGSSDNTLEIVREFARHAPFPVRLKMNQTNVGSTKNFEQAISLSQGAIVALADQDDVWYPPKLKQIENVFLRSDDVVLVFSDADVIDNDSRLVGRHLWSSFSFDAAKQHQVANGDALAVLIRHPVVTGATMAFRRELLPLVTPIPDDEIHDRWISYLLAVRGRFDIIPQPLMQYRQHGSQQLGLPPKAARERMVHARDKGANFYAEEIHRFEQIRDWVQARRIEFPYAEHALKEIERKLSHLAHRVRLAPIKVARLPNVLRESLNGNYWRYSGGWISIVKDLAIR